MRETDFLIELLAKHNLDIKDQFNESINYNQINNLVEEYLSTLSQLAQPRRFGSGETGV